MKKEVTAIEVVKRIVAVNKDIRELTFAAYYYVPQSLSDLGLLQLYRLKRPTVQKIDRMISVIRKKLKKRWTLGITSKVKLRNGESRHIPQVDFACPYSSKNLEKVHRCLSHFVKIKPGYILKSGRSYHFYSSTLLTQRKWEVFIGNSLLCNLRGKSVVVDARWFAYSIRRGFSNLRIIASYNKPEPKLTART